MKAPRCAHGLHIDEPVCGKPRENPLHCNFLLPGSHIFVTPTPDPARLAAALKSAE